MFVCLVLLLCDLPQTALLNLSLDGGLCLSIFYLPLLSFLLFICCYCSLLSSYPVVKVIREFKIRSLRTTDYVWA